MRAHWDVKNYFRRARFSGRHWPRAGVAFRARGVKGFLPFGRQMKFIAVIVHQNSSLFVKRVIDPPCVIGHFHRDDGVKTLRAVPEFTLTERGGLARTKNRECEVVILNFLIQADHLITTIEQRNHRQQRQADDNSDSGSDSKSFQGVLLWLRRAL